MSIPSYKSNSVTVPEDVVPSHVMDCQTLLKLHNSRKPSSRYDSLRYSCDICRAFFAPSKFLVLTHKAVEHKIPIPMDYKG